MKNQSEKGLQKISAEEIKGLTIVVKETLATVRPTRFGAIDMWDLQRRRRTMMQRRKHFA